MFRKSYVHHQEDNILYIQFYRVCFSCIYVSSLAEWTMCTNIDLKKAFFLLTLHNKSLQWEPSWSMLTEGRTGLHI